MVEYKLVIGHTVNELNDKINEHLAAGGWHLYEGPFICEGVFAQALNKWVPKPLC